MITTSYDPEADAMFIRFGDTARSETTEEVAPGIMLDFDSGGHLVAIEILDLSTRAMATQRAA